MGLLLRANQITAVGLGWIVILASVVFVDLHPKLQAKRLTWLYRMSSQLCMTTHLTVPNELTAMHDESPDCTE